MESKGFSDTMDIGSAILAALAIMLILLIVLVVGAVLFALGLFMIGFSFDIYTKYGGGIRERIKR